MSTSTALKTGDFTLHPSMTPYVARGIFVLACMVVAFNDSFYNIAINAVAGAANYSVLLFLMTAVLFVGIDRKRARALNIHDREVDYIIGGMAVIIAITIKVELLPRFAEWDALLRLDIFAILVFAFGACGLIFGMRSTLHFGPGWVLLFGYGAPVFLVVSIIFGGGWWGPTMATIIGMSLAVTVAANRDPIQSIYFGLLTFTIGSGFAVLLWLVADPPKWTTQLPALVATLLVVFNASCGNQRQWLIHRRVPTVKNVKPAVAALIVAAVVLTFFPLPKSTWNPELGVASGPAQISRLGVSVPPGWKVTDFIEYGWAERYFGPDSSLTRQMLAAREYDPDWDANGLMRTVAVDTLRVGDAYQARTFGDETLYSTLNGRRSEEVSVDLGRGVRGRAYTVLDESDFLTYTKLIFTWTREDGVMENITVIAVDDHRPEARFPELAPSLVRLLAQVSTILWRGNAVTVDTETQFKDLDLVTEVARDLVEWEYEGPQ